MNEKMKRMLEEEKPKLRLAIHMYDILMTYEDGIDEMYNRLQQFTAEHERVCKDKGCLVPRMCRSVVSEWLGERHFCLPDRDDS